MPSDRQHAKDTALHFLCTILIGLPSILLFSGADGEDAAPRGQLQNLSLAEQEELRRKSETFKSLSETEQDRMRELHVAISSSPDSDRLYKVMLLYHDWLKSLTAKERAEVLSLPTDTRIEQIKQLMEEQRQQRFRELVRTPLSAEDVRAIFSWLDFYAQGHQEELLELLPETMRERVSQPNVPSSVQRKMLMMAVGSRGNDVQLPPPTDEEFEKLSQSLSEKAKAALMKLPEREQQLQLVREWLRAGVASRMTPQVSRERLLSFYREYRERTTDKKRVEEFDALPPDEFYEEVKKLYIRSRGHWRGRRDGEQRFGPHKRDDRDRVPEGEPLHRNPLGDRGRPGGDGPRQPPIRNTSPDSPPNGPPKLPAER